jgi:hypothetical protein
LEEKGTSLTTSLTIARRDLEEFDEPLASGTAWPQIDEADDQIAAPRYEHRTFLVRCEEPDRSLEEPESIQWARYYWGLPVEYSVVGKLETSIHPIFVAVAATNFGYAEEITALESGIPKLTGALNDDDGPGRGVVALSYKRRVLFGDSIEIRTAELPRWKPRIHIDDRALDEEE